MTTTLRDWCRGGYALDRWDATATAHARKGKTLVTVTLTRLPGGEQDGAVISWSRVKPQSWQKRARVWRAVDRYGGRWSIEYGYDGRWWVLFGPDGAPFGDQSLSSRVHESLEEASVWIATQVSHLRDITENAEAGA